MYDDNSESPPSPRLRELTVDLCDYIRTVFRDDDPVSYSSDIRVTPDGTMSPVPGRTVTRKAGDLLASLEKYPSDIGATIGDRAANDGALIRYNAPGRYDTAVIEFQGENSYKYMRAIRDLKLPAIGYIGSINDDGAVVKIGAGDINEYRERLDYLASVLKAKGYTIAYNPNPDGFVRMPGTCFNTHCQRFVPHDVSPLSWDEWKTFAEELTDGLPDIVPLSDYADNPPERPEALIEGVLRRGHKMIISGPSKSGKSFILMELCIAIVEGLPWLGFPCRPGRVLYINLEIDSASCISRFLDIYKALGIVPIHSINVEVWNLRGHAAPLEQLAPKIISRAKSRKINAVILDPFYKLNSGDENNAGDMARFVNEVDRICTETGASVIYSHHHSKSSADRKAINRASGSTVFARDPDAILDMIDLVRPQEIEADISDSATALRMSFILREFPSPGPINLWFDYPLHRLDEVGDLADAAIDGDYQGQGRKSSSSNKVSDDDHRYEDFVDAYTKLSQKPPVKVDDLAEHMGVTPRTIRERIKIYDEFMNTRGIVTRRSEC